MILNNFKIKKLKHHETVLPEIFAYTSPMFVHKLLYGVSKQSRVLLGRKAHIFQIKFIAKETYSMTYYYNTVDPLVREEDCYVNFTVVEKYISPSFNSIGVNYKLHYEGDRRKYIAINTIEELERAI